jgi:ankyrin repeat protein
LLLQEVKEKFSLPSDISSVIISYFDEDLTTFVVLDEGCWSDFASQTKKHIQLNYHGTTFASLPSSTVVTPIPEHHQQQHQQNNLSVESKHEPVISKPSSSESFPMLGAFPSSSFPSEYPPPPSQAPPPLPSVPAPASFEDYLSPSPMISPALQSSSLDKTAMDTAYLDSVNMTGGSALKKRNSAVNSGNAYDDLYGEVMTPKSVGLVTPPKRAVEPPKNSPLSSPNRPMSSANPFADSSEGVGALPSSLSAIKLPPGKSGKEENTTVGGGGGIKNRRAVTSSHLAMMRFKIYDLNEFPLLLYLQSFLSYGPLSSSFSISSFLHSFSTSASSAGTSSSSSSEQLQCNKKKKWLINKKYPPLGSKVYSINGVKVMNIDKDFQLALIKQKQRPLIIEFEFIQTFLITTPVLIIPPSAPPSFSVTATAVDESTSSSNINGDSYRMSSDTMNPYNGGSFSAMSVSTSQQSTASSSSVLPILVEATHGNNMFSPDKEGSFHNQTHQSVILATPVMKEISVPSPLIPSSGISATDHTIKFSFFISKYSSSYCNKLRKKVDHILKDFIECDWARAKMDGQTKPQKTITSIYHYIENEMIKLDVFNNKRSRGLGSPDIMTEAHWESLKDCIEYFIFKKITQYTKVTLFPLYQEKPDIMKVEEYDDPPSLVIDSKLNLVQLKVQSHSPKPISQPMNNTFQYEKIELSHDMPLMIKIAFLRFLTLENLGLSYDLGGGKTSKPHNGHNEPESTSSGNRQPPITSTGTNMKSYYQNILTTYHFIRYEMIHSEEWYLAIKGLSRSLSMEIPYDILRKLVKVITLISRNLEGYILTKKKNQQIITSSSTSSSSSSSAMSVTPAAGKSVSVSSLSSNLCIFNSSYYGNRSIICGCGKLHLYSPEKEEITLPTIDSSHSTATLDDLVIHSVTSGSVSSSVHVDTASVSAGNNIAPSSPFDDHHSTLPTAVAVAHQAALLEKQLSLLKSTAFIKSFTDDEGEGKKEAQQQEQQEEEDPGSYSISADDLLPAIVWVLLQSNIINVDYMIWICSEFRHPSLLRGEEAYCLAQLSSALEFIKHANYLSFDISREIYSLALLQYSYTLRLLLACKNNDLSLLKECLLKGANINGLSPDYRDSVLTACIQYHSMECLRFLLTNYAIAIPSLSPPGGTGRLGGGGVSSSREGTGELLVDNLIHLFHGPNERCTALFKAIQQECLESTILLLQYGANRYIVDDGGNTLFKIVTDEKESPIFLTLLLADTLKYNYISSILHHSERIVGGLLLQGIPIFPSCFDTERCLLSPVITAILVENIAILCLLLCNSCQLFIEPVINEMNSFQETALLLCVKLALLDPNNYRYVIMASILLRNGANRYLSDIYGQSAVSLMNEVDVNHYYPDTSLTQEKKNHLRNGAIGYYHEKLRKEGITIPILENDIFLYELFEDHHQQQPPATARPSSSSSGDVKKKESSGFTHRDHQNNYENYALFYMKLLILNDPSPSNTNPLTKALPIYDFARNKDAYGMKIMLLQGIDINASSPGKGYNALISAVYNEDITMIKLLLKCVKIYALTDYQSVASTWFNEFYTYFSTTVSNKAEYEKAIHYVNQCRTYQTSLVLDINAQGRQGMTALHYAAQLGNASMVGLLLQYSAKRDITNQKGHIPLDIALANGHIDAANALRFDPNNVSICLAAKHGDWLVMKSLLCQGVSINKTKQHINPKTKDYVHELYTPLIAAVAYGQHSLIQQMLDSLSSELDVNQANLLGQTPLMYAATRGDEGIVLKLLKVGANRKVVDISDRTAEYWATQQLRQITTVNNAINAAIHPSTSSSSSSSAAATPLMKNTLAPSIHSTASSPVSIQSTTSYENTIHLLRNDPSKIFIHDLIRKNDFQGVIAMLKQGVDVNQKRYSYLPSSATWIEQMNEEGGGEGGGRKYKEDADDNEPPVMMLGKSGKSSSMSAVNTGNTGKESLKSQRSSSNRQGSEKEANKSKRSSTSSIKLTTVTGTKIDIAELQLIKEIDPLDEESFIIGETPLIVASRYNRLEILALLLKAPNIDVNLTDTYGNTALFHAAFKGNEESILLLLKAKVTRKPLNKKKQTPVDYALIMNNLAIAALIDSDPYCVHIHDQCEKGKMHHVLALLKQGCPPNYRDERLGLHSQTPLMAAAQGGKADILRMLLRYPEVAAGKDDRDSLGRTALMRAASVGALDCTGILLNAGVDRNLTDNSGLSARDYASRHSFSCMVQFMSQSVIR